MKVLSLLLTLLLTSCASYVRTQSNKMISPEANGGLGTGQLEARLESQKRDRLDFTNDKTNNRVERADAPYGLAGLGEVGIFKYLDLYLQPHFSSATIFGAKYQLIGKARTEAGANNFSSSILAGYGHGSRSYNSSGDLDDLFNDNLKKVSMETTHTEVGLINGYRWSKNFLQYTNVIYQNQVLEGKVTNNSGTLTDAEFKYTQDGVIYSTGFILYFAKAHWKVDYSHFVSDWSRTAKHTVNSVNTALGFNW